ncbi:MAG: hypothetical protein ABIY55_20640 [Kofleriaceae bacterium]
MPPFMFSIDLEAPSHRRNVELVRTSVQNCFVAVFSDVAGCNAIAMVTGELVENAIKYGHWTGDAKSFRLQVKGHIGSVTVQVENPIDPANPRTDELRGRLGSIEEFPSAEAAYQAKLLEIAARPGNLSGGLGLVRCAYEGNSKLRVEAIDGHAIRVIAEMTF